jgi:uncharacterized protein YndB with AHSA1/START domain
MRVSVSTTIERPRDEVYALVSDLAAHRQWTDHFLVDWEIEGDVARMRAKGGGGRGEARIVESTPERIVEEVRSGKRLVRGTYELREAGPSRTDVTFTNQSVERGTRLDVLFDPIAKTYLKRNNQKAMDRLKALMESGA